MRTIITYQNKSFIEQDQTRIKLIKARCSKSTALGVACDNELIIPLACVVLGIVEGCSHCGKDYPAVAHCDAITESYKDLIEEGGIVSLD